MLDAKIIYPSSVRNCESKEVETKIIITGWINKPTSVYLKRPPTRGIIFIPLLKDFDLFRKIAIAGMLFDLKIEKITYIGCIIDREAITEKTTIDKLIFKNEIKVYYLKVD